MKKSGNKMRSVKPYKIESGLKVPPISVNRQPSQPSAAAMTIAMLGKGQSFQIADELEAMKARKVLLDFTASEKTRKGTREFTARKVGGGVRIWRVK